MLGRRVRGSTWILVMWARGDGDLEQDDDRKWEGSS